MSIISLILYVALAAATAFVVANLPVWYAGRKITERNAKRLHNLKILGIFSLIFVTGAAALNLTTFALAHNYDNTSRAVSVQDVAASFGLKHDTTYPLTLSNFDPDINPSDDDAFRVFGGTWQDPKLGPVLRTTFTHQNTTSSILIPLRTIVIHVSKVTEPSVTLRLSNTSSYMYGRTAISASHDCTPIVRNALVVCRREVTSTPLISEQTSQEKLVGLINQPGMVQTATFVVTPAMNEALKKAMDKNN